MTRSEFTKKLFGDDDCLFLTDNEEFIIEKSLKIINKLEKKNITEPAEDSDEDLEWRVIGPDSEAF